ncbi:MAG: Enoyl-CoA hydratase [uncultured Acidimicrobiales bacterium]|uniref:Enoyl-CoA hydratase n=1 Tax=uncultured Acidimicrobiales bacterium TaxID=310071 RepID=A0A6J4IFF8_9ACTN|nr:MAG: Enoyl-CoA hydratase [uncultured Acidimicrobiales bacterium]
MIRLGWETDEVAHITLDRPRRRNALDVQACTDLRAATEEVVAAGARSVVLRGSGGHFCSGADLAAVEDPAFTPALQAALQALAQAPLLVVAALEGACMGGGVQLALAADVRVVSTDARLSVPAARLGLAVDGWTARRLAAVAGAGEAAALLLAAAEIDGARAHAIGLAQRIGTPADAVAWALEAAALAPLTVQAHKLALACPDGDPEAEAARAAAWRSADLREGRAAFAERRPPRFTGR